MKITTTILFLLIPFVSFSQNCDYFETDTLNICGYEFTLSTPLDQTTISYDCENNHYLGIDFLETTTNLTFSACGVYQLFHNSIDGTCTDTLFIQVSDPNTTNITQSTNIDLGYGTIDCPGNVVASCYEPSVTITINSLPPSPVWSFCTTSACESNIYTPNNFGNSIDCISDSISIDTISSFSSISDCTDTSQFAFIVLDSQGETVTDNAFLEYLAQLQDASDLDCPYNGLDCSFSNTSTCYDSIVMDTTLLPIPVRLGGQWTLPLINTVQLQDSTYFQYFGQDYELILNPGVDFYGPGSLEVIFNKIFITGSNDTIRDYPEEFTLTLQWEEEWTYDTITIIKERHIDTDDDCFTCGGYLFNSGFNVPDIPAFPCGPVSIYYPSSCECEYEEPAYTLELISCHPRQWQLEVISNNQFQSASINGTNLVQTGQNIFTLDGDSHYHNSAILLFDNNGCVYYLSIQGTDYLAYLDIDGNNKISCEQPTTTISVGGVYYYSGGNYDDLSTTIWSNGQVGSSITVNAAGTYTATFIDNHGCEHSASSTVIYDHSVICLDENPIANTECHLTEPEIICEIETMESFYYSMPSQSSGGLQPNTLCNGDGQVDNISWFSFVAFDGDYSINISPSNCSSYINGQIGIQVGLYTDCSFSDSPFCSADCTTGEISIPSQNLIEGQVYHMYIDGCSGSVCDYNVDIEGNPESPSLAPESMTLLANGETTQIENAALPQEYCLGTNVNCILDGVSIQGEYHWTINTLQGEIYPIANATTENNSLDLTFESRGTYEICINEILNGCELYTWEGQICYTVNIDNTDNEDFGTHYICQGEAVNFDPTILSTLDPNLDGILGIQTTFQAFQEGLNTAVATDARGCTYQQTFNISYYTPSIIPTEEITECRSSLPIDINGTTLYASDFENDNVLLIEQLSDLTNQNGCDSVIQYRIEILDNPSAEFTLSSDSMCVSDQLILNTEINEELNQEWTFDGGTNMNSENPVLMFESPGWKTITLTTHNENCSSEVVSRSVFVSEDMPDIEIVCVDQGLHALTFAWNDVQGVEGYLVSVGNQPAVTVLENTFIADQLLDNTEYSISISAITDHKCPPSVATTSCTTKECIPLEFAFDIPDMLCIEDEMEVIELKATSPNQETELIWSGPNVVDNIFDPKGLPEGNYEIEIRHQIEDCVSIDIIEISIISPPTFEMNYDEIICHDEISTSIEILTESLGYTIIIDGEVSESISEITPGTHEIVLMNDQSCESGQTILIEQDDEPSISIIGDLFVKEGDDHVYSFDLSQSSDIDVNSIVWMINDEEYCSGEECLTINPSLVEDSDIEVYALTNLGCEATSTIRVIVDRLEPELVIPNIFSPNDDGLNDYWFVIPNKEDIKIESIQILDRWNNLVYSHIHNTSNLDMKWDGSLNGTKLQPGVYIYAISYSSEDIKETVYGDVTLLK